MVDWAIGFLRNLTARYFAGCYGLHFAPFIKIPLNRRILVGRGHGFQCRIFLAKISCGLSVGEGIVEESPSRTYDNTLSGSGKGLLIVSTEALRAKRLSGFALANYLSKMWRRSLSRHGDVRPGAAAGIVFQIRKSLPIPYK